MNQSILNLLSASSMSAPVSVVTPATMPTIRTYLPKLQKFKGNFMCWMSFWDSFKAAIHNNPDISQVDKFNYLIRRIS